VRGDISERSLEKMMTTIAGANPPAAPYRVIHLAWTFDDGPTSQTSPMKAALGDRPATWFVMRDRLGSGAAEDAALQALVARQSDGDEIAIHSSHPTLSHVAWFPVHVASSVPLAYTSIADLIADLNAFTLRLRNAGVVPKFVRMPGGEITEVAAYLKSKGVPKQRLITLAQRILRQEPVDAEAPGVRNVADDYDLVRATLEVLGLWIWGGSAIGPLLSSQSWEAESSGTGLTDDATDKFKRLTDAFDHGVKKQRSLILLAHDTAAKNVARITLAIQQMEAYAVQRGVQIQYHTKSSLFEVVRGFVP